jgi:hypothetical protein
LGKINNKTNKKQYKMEFNNTKKRPLQVLISQQYLVIDDLEYELSLGRKKDNKILNHKILVRKRFSKYLKYLLNKK